MNVALLYPPVADASMPPAGPPWLQAAIRALHPRAEVRCVDLNASFFRELFGEEYTGELARYRTTLAEGDFAEAARASFRFHDFVDAACRRLAERWPGHTLVFGTHARYTPPGDRTGGTPVWHYAHQPSPFDECVRRTLAGLPEPNVVGVGLSCASQALPAARLLVIARELWPEARCVVGGGIPEGALGASMRDGLGALADRLVFDEAEEPLLALVDELAGGPHAEDVRPAPPRYDDFPVGEYPSPVAALPILASRHGSAEDVLAELRWHYTHRGVRHFSFADGPVSPRRLAGIVEGLLAEGPDVRLKLQADLDPAFLDPELVERIGRAGVCDVCWGRESVDEGTLRAMNKRFPEPLRYDEIFAAFTDAGAHNSLVLLTGAPHAGPGADLAAARYLREARDVHAARVVPFVAHRDTPDRTPGEERPADPEGVVEDHGALVPPTGLSLPDVAAAFGEALLARPDLRFTSILHDDERFAFAARFGGRYAQENPPETLLDTEDFARRLSAPGAANARLMAHAWPSSPGDDASAGARSPSSRDDADPPAGRLRASERRLWEAREGLARLAAGYATLPFAPLEGLRFVGLSEDDDPEHRGLRLALADDERRIDLHVAPFDAHGSGLHNGDALKLFAGDATALRDDREARALGALGLALDAFVVTAPADRSVDAALAAVPRPAPPTAPAPRSDAAPAPRAPSSPGEQTLRRAADLVRDVLARLEHAARSPLPGWALRTFAPVETHEGFRLEARLDHGRDTLGLVIAPSDAATPAAARGRFLSLCFTPDSRMAPVEAERGLPALCRILDHYLARAEEGAKRG